MSKRIKKGERTVVSPAELRAIVRKNKIKAEKEWLALDSQPLTREDLLELIYKDWIEGIIDNVNCNDIWDYMHPTFLNGMKGFNEFTDAELIMVARKQLNLKINLVESE